MAVDREPGFAFAVVELLFYLRFCLCSAIASFLEILGLFGAGLEVQVHYVQLATSLAYLVCQIDQIAPAMYSYI